MEPESVIKIVHQVYHSFFFYADNLRELKMYICDNMSVGVMKDYKRKLRNLHGSHTLGWSWNWNT